MKKIGKKKALFACFSMKFMVFLFLIITLNAFNQGAIKVIDASKNDIKLSEIIKETSVIPLSQFYTSNVISSTSLPKILVWEEKGGDLAAANFFKMYLINISRGEAYKTFEIKNAINIFNSDDPYSPFLQHKENNDVKFSRFDMKSGKILWSIPSDFTSVYLYNSFKGVPRIVIVPIIFHKIPGTRNIMIYGLVEKKSTLFKTKYACRVLILNGDTGKIIKDREFDYYRYLQNNIDCLFIDSKKREFEVINTFNGETRFKGMYNIGDLLGTKKYLVVAKKRFPRYWLYGRELSTILTENTLIISAGHKGDALGDGMKQSSWAKFDHNGQRLEKLTPSPNSTLELLIRSLGGETWPAYVLHFKKTSKLRRVGVEKLLVINKDGTITDAPLPVIEEIKRFLFLGTDNWFRDGKKIYYLKGGNLFKFIAGEKTGAMIYQKNKKEQWSAMPHGDKKYVMLIEKYYPKNDSILINLEDGKVVPSSEFSNKMGSNVWTKVMAYNFCRKLLTKQGLPATYKRYLNIDFGNAGSTHSETIECNKKKEGRELNMLRIWGSPGGEENHDDIGLVPAVLKGGSSILVGIKIPENKVLFYLPLLSIKGLEQNLYPSGYKFPFKVINLNQKESLLIVFETLNSLKVYKIQRPII